MGDRKRMAYHGMQVRDRLPGLTVSLGESINVSPSSLNGLVPVRHTRSKSEPAAPPFLTKLPPAVANVPKEDIRGYVHAKRVTNYLVGSTLGEGSFAKVKEAFHVLVGEKVAMKVIDKKKAMQDSYVAKNFRREARLLQMVCHPNILQLLEVIETDNSYYLIVELCSGGELMKHIYKCGHLSEEESRKYMRQIVSAVDHLHRAHIIHRDLKVENLLLDANMNIKLIDFGLSNEEFIQGEEGLIHCHTQCGSPAYAAPELLGHKDYGPEVDIWSIGVNMYAMLTGCLPYTVEPFNITALHAKMLENKMNPIPDHLSDSCKDLLRRLLTSNPEERIKMPELFRHPWLNEGHTLPFQPAPFPNHLTANDFNEDITEHMVHVLKVKASEEELKQELLSNRATSAAALYHLLEARLTRYNRQFPTKPTARVRRRVKRVSQDQGYFESDEHDDMRSIISCPTHKTAPFRPATRHVPLRHNKAGKPRPVSDYISDTTDSSRRYMRRRTMPPTVLEEDLANFHIRQRQGGESRHLTQTKCSTLPRHSPRNTSPPPDPYEYDLPRPTTHLNPVRPPPSMTRNFSQPQALNQLRHDLTNHFHPPSLTTPAWHSQPTSRTGSRNPSRAGSRNPSRAGSRHPSGVNTREPSETFIGRPPSTQHLPTDLEGTDELQFHDVEASYTAKHRPEHTQPRNFTVGSPEDDSSDVHFPTIHHSPARKSTKTTTEFHKPSHRNGFLSSSGEFEIRTELGVEAILSEVLRVASNLNMREIEQSTHNTVICLYRGIKFQIAVHKDRRSSVCRFTFQWLAGGDHGSYNDICGQIIRKIAL